MTYSSCLGSKVFVDVIDHAIKLLLALDYDCVSKTITSTLPDGIDAEVSTFSALKKVSDGVKLSPEIIKITYV